MSKMTKSELRDVIDAIIPTLRDDDGDYVAILPKDENFGHDVFIFFVLNEDGDKFQMLAGADLKVADASQAIAFCNRWNTEKSFGQAFFKDGAFRMTFTLNEPADVSNEYLKGFIKLNLAVAWQFYTEIAKEFGRQTDIS